ncbi:hypothetical protein [Verrucosispora sioxanthis]|uniref:hypothetical protein n=1 Tax=Verrucosispora sioxanthis TaxID=2499994 RepID=UPI0035A1C46E
MLRPGSSPCPSIQVSGSTNSGAASRPCSASISARWAATSSVASAGTRLSTRARTAPLARALCSSSQGTASAYRAAVVTKSQRSAAASSWLARARLASTTESMSGASRNASPGGSAGAVTRCRVRGSSPGWLVRVSPGSSSPRRNQAESAGLQTSTGDRVVGRSTPAALTRACTRLLTRVDLPAPVDPPTTTSSGASRRARRGSR